MIASLIPILRIAASLVAFALPAAALAQGVTFYEGTDFQGRTFSLDGPFADFGDTCRTFGPGDYARLPSPLDISISSGRRISDEYPYAAPRNGGR